MLDDYVESDHGFNDLVAAGFKTELVERIVQLVDVAEYKRRHTLPARRSP